MSRYDSSSVPVPGYDGKWPFEVYYADDEPGKLRRFTCGFGFSHCTPDVPEVRYGLTEGSYGVDSRIPGHEPAGLWFEGLDCDNIPAMCASLCELIDLKRKWYNRNEAARLANQVQG